MLDFDLPLFSTAKSPSTSSTPNVEIQNSQIGSINPLESIEKALQGILPQNTEENVVIKTRRILNERAKSFSDEQIQYTITEFQYLINTWLDEFEKDVFNGMTLKELFNDK